MITTPTVLVLGAGASVPYGYPSGEDLMKKICEDLNNDSTVQFKTLHEFGSSRRDIINFRRALFLSGKSSVDAFLEHRRELIEIGKLAIAQTLTFYEIQDNMFEKGDWYQYFYDKLNTSFEEFDQNKIAVITFNYDRSFEHYLFTALQNSYGMSDEECEAKLQNIPIVHVYGQLSPLPWQGKNGRPYERPDRSVPDTFMRYLKIAASAIKIIHEDTDIRKDPEFVKAHKLLSEAENIYFLGFGYHEINLRRLHVPLADKKITVELLIS